jgi:hypothetical protein
MLPPNFKFSEIVKIVVIAGSLTASALEVSDRGRGSSSAFLDKICSERQNLQ